MRINTPVTNIEFLLDEHQTLVSATTLKGLITYANPYFVEVSGYSATELLGAPHNILRHPDMPAEAYSDLWASIKAGLSWTGMVKNRRKNGDFYWVFANVIPIIEKGEPVGYLSVRIKPDREQVAAAAQLYREFETGNPRGIALRQGQVIRTGWRGKLLAVTRFSLGARIRLAAAGLLTSTGVLSVLACQAGGALSYGVSFVTLALLGWLWYFLEGGIVNPLKQALTAVQTIAGGDLTGIIETTRTDDMGQLLRSLRQLRINLDSIIGDVRANFEQIKKSTHELAAGNMDLSGRTESQAAALEQSAASMEQIATTVEQNAINAGKANVMAGKASDVAQAGGDIIHRVVATISDISASSHQIVSIINIINDIAFQTNILALNAAVEAARAGEQGRGFAVVAGEVRNLATRSATAASEIKQLIDQSVLKVDAGIVLTDNAGNIMQQIIDSVSQVTMIMHDISNASREQSVGINQVNQAIVNIDEVTQQNAALVEQAAAATATLEEHANVLMQSLTLFKLSGSTARMGVH